MIMEKIYEVAVDDSGTTTWRLNGELHREGGPAIENSNGDYSWYKNGKLHREDGPAFKKVFVGVEACGYEAWYLEGQLHRLDGPAFEYDDGNPSWYIDGEELTKEEFDKRTCKVKSPLIAYLEEMGFKNTEKGIWEFCTDDGFIRYNVYVGEWYFLEIDQLPECKTIYETFPVDDPMNFLEKLRNTPVINRYSKTTVEQVCYVGNIIEFDPETDIVTHLKAYCLKCPRT